MKLRNVGYRQLGRHVDYCNGALLIRRGEVGDVSDRMAAHLERLFPGAFLPVGDAPLMSESLPPAAAAPRRRGRPRKVV